MAGANLPAKKYSKKSPTVTRLSFEFDGASTQYIDIARALSILNRRFYRQGVYYYVNSVEVYNNETGVVDLHTLPDNWITKNAWNRGFRLFQKMNAMVAPPLATGFKPKYHDFKVYMSPLHQSTGSASPRLHGINATINTAGMNPGDWQYSQFVSADDDGDMTDPTSINQDADEFFVHMLGDHQGSSDNWTSVGLIKSYQDSRRTINTADVVDTPTTLGAQDPLINVFDFSSEEQMNDIIDNLDNDNDNAPYDEDYYIGRHPDHMQHVARIGTEQGVGRIGRAAGFCAPMGLICVDPHGVNTAFRVVLNLAVGTYHGVYAERA